MIEADEVLEFWFGYSRQDPQQIQVQKKIWYRSNETTDELIRTRFGSILHRAEHGELDHWCENKQSRLALIIVLDQFSRHIYRGTADAFKSDFRALEIASDFDDYHSLSFIEQVFALHPFKHSEQLSNQEISLRRFAELVQNSTAEWHPIMKDFYRNAEQHHGIIKRFGRFPHRNAVQQRDNSLAEQKYLDNTRSRFGQKNKHQPTEVRNQ